MNTNTTKTTQSHTFQINDGVKFDSESMIGVDYGTVISVAPKSIVVRTDYADVRVFTSKTFVKLVSRG